jgi:hypothetical protein
MLRVRTEQWVIDRMNQTTVGIAVVAAAAASSSTRNHTTAQWADQMILQMV